MATPLPVIVGFGGYNAAGRSSFHQGFRRMVLESLPESEQQKTIVSLACLMKAVTLDGDGDGDGYRDAKGTVLSAEQVAQAYKQQIIDGTLVRRIEEEALFEPGAVSGHKKVSLESEEALITFILSKRDMPHLVPESWTVTELEKGKVKVETSEKSAFLVESVYELAAKAAGQLPTGFNPGDHYNARFHPRGLQMTILGASDAVHSVGIPWDKIAGSVQPDQIGVYASSVLSQMHEEGFGGMVQARLKGGRPTAKQLPLGLNSMPADFVNAYVVGSVGHTEAVTGACASFLYVLNAAIRDIRNGKRRVAVVGNAESAITPELMEGFINMSALANDENLCKLDGTDTPNWRTASRPFGDNCGFTIAESSQYLVLMDDALAIELGADIHGAVPEVFINADGVKKSISAPGAGNYICFAKAVAAAINIAGEESVRNHSFVHAHGSSTPANRVSESAIIDRVAGAFGIENWPVTAVKAFLGHSMSTASGDQLVSALGTFKYDLIPGIKTIAAVADDVHQQHALFPLQDMNVTDSKMDVAFINSKGFGGNNATAVVLSPEKVGEMLAKRHSQLMDDYLTRCEQTRQAAAAYEQRADGADLDVIYRFGEELIDESEIAITPESIKVPGFDCEVEFDQSNPWSDMS